MGVGKGNRWSILELSSSHNTHTHTHTYICGFEVDVLVEAYANEIIRVLSDIKANKGFNSSISLRKKAARIRSRKEREL